jgi:hypothetical protein
MTIPTSDKLINIIITGKIFFTSGFYNRKIICFLISWRIAKLIAVDRLSEPGAGFAVILTEVYNTTFAKKVPLMI